MTNLSKNNIGEYKTLGELLPSELLSQAAQDVVRSESVSSLVITEDRSLRVKVTDICGLACTFCHNEGTPVNDAQRNSGRVSIFQITNNVSFKPGVVQPDQPFVDALTQLRDSLGINEIHFTGGEPTLHPRFFELTKLCSSLGFKVSITSNGETGAIYDKSTDTGISNVNFSIFGTTPEELAAVQSARFNNPRLAKKKIEQLSMAIKSCVSNRVNAKANIVMQSSEHEDRIERIISEFSQSVKIRILPDLGIGNSSVVAVYEYLAKRGAVAKRRNISAGSSNLSVDYKLASGDEIGFKQIRPTRIPICNKCPKNNSVDCPEGFYGTRLYIDDSARYRVGICLLRMDLTQDLSTFLSSDLPKQIVNLRQSEYDELQSIL